MTSGLPRRAATGATGQRMPAAALTPRAEPTGEAYSAVRAALADLRMRVPGVRGGVLGGVDGLLITYDLASDEKPHDLAALAATTYGLGRR